MASPSFDRADMLRRLESSTFDVVVIGGGITGAGVALDAATRGLRTALIERDDFASGTSSKSSKMVHGGLRYLQQGEIRLVYQALHERQRLRKNAPHLVHLLPFMIPILTRGGVVSRKVARGLGMAMWGYDLTGGWRIGKLHKKLKGDAAFAHLPTMPRDRLAFAYLYYDTGTDDARLCLTVARTAAAHGAAVANRCAAVGIAKGDGASSAVTGVEVEADGRRFTISTRSVVNAAGVWSDDVRLLDEGTHPDSIRPAKGVHVAVPWEKVRNDIAVVIPVPKDRRSLFVVPWGPLPDGTYQHTYIGTTDTDYHGPLDDPQCTADDLAYVLNALNATVTTGITEADVSGVWAGLRPLVNSASSGRTADLSRRHKVGRSASGMVSVTGGKLTTYREMASDTVDEVMRVLGRSGRSQTKNLKLLGADGYTAPPTGSPEAHLTGRYGTLASEVRALVADDPALGEPLVEGLPYLKAEAVYAVRHEMATTLDDVFERRTRARLFDRESAVAAAGAVASLIAPHLGWNAAETAQQVAGFQAVVGHELAAARAPGETVAANAAPGEANAAAQVPPAGAGAGA